MRYLAVLLMVAACGGGGADDDDDAVDGGGGGGSDARTPQLAGACPLDAKLGDLIIATRDDGGGVTYAEVKGEFYDQVNPTTVLEPLEEADGCQLLRKNNPFCDPPCDGATTTCSQAGTCVPVGRLRSVGTLKVRGLEVELDLEPNGNRYGSFDVPNPPFSADAAIFADASGGELAGFALEGYGVEPLAVASNEWTIFQGQPLDITWTASSGRGRILATLNVDQHGNSPVTMYCEWDDDGSATIPASMIDTFLSYGYSGAASGNLYRLTVDSATVTEGCVELRVMSHLRALLAIDGFDGGPGPNP